MVKNESGLVVLRYYQPIPKYVVIGGKEYVCDVRHSVALLLVPESEVPALLAHRGGCCGKQRQVFYEASQEAYNIWNTGQR